MSTEEVKKGNDLQRFKVKRMLETLKSKKGFHTELKAEGEKAGRLGSWEANSTFII